MSKFTRIITVVGLFCFALASLGVSFAIGQKEAYQAAEVQQARVVVAAAQAAGAPPKVAAPASDKWEYRVVTMNPLEEDGKAQKELSAYGEEGFRLISTTSIPTPLNPTSGTFVTTRFVMERQKPSGAKK